MSSELKSMYSGAYPDSVPGHVPSSSTSQRNWSLGFFRWEASNHLKFRPNSKFGRIAGRWRQISTSWHNYHKLFKIPSSIGTFFVHEKIYEILAGINSKYWLVSGRAKQIHTQPETRGNAGVALSSRWTTFDPTLYKSFNPLSSYVF